MKMIIYLAILLQSYGFVFGQEKEEISAKLDHFSLAVKDVDQSAEFYKSVLNLKEIINKTKKDGIRWLSLGDGKELHLISTINNEVKLNKAVHLALTTSNFDLLISKLQSMQIKYSDWPGNAYTINIRPDGIKQIYFQDPDGYWIEVNSVGDNTK